MVSIGKPRRSEVRGAGPVKRRVCPRRCLTALTIVSAAIVCAKGESLVFPPYLHSYGIRKATPKHLLMFFGPRTFFDDPQGLATARLAIWEDPKTDHDDDEVVVYGVNSGRHQIIFNTSIWALDFYGKKGTGNNQFFHPKGIAADGHGNVYVADSGNNRVVRLFNPKSSLQWKGAFNGTPTTGQGLKGPSRVGIDESGNVYVTDPGNKRIVVFDSSGKLLRVFPPAGSGYLFTEGPTALAVADGGAKWSYYSRETAVFCADKNGARVWKLGFDGKLLARGTMPPGHSAVYGAVDYYHNYWVTDTRNHCIVKFDHTLTMLDKFGSFGKKDNQFVEPRGIAIYKRYGQTFIAEQKGAQYFWVGSDLKEAVVQKIAPNRYLMAISTTEHSLVTLFSAVGKDTVTYFKKKWIPCGADTLDFFGTEQAGIREQGLTLKLEPTYSSFTYNRWYFPVKLKMKGLP